MKEAVELLRGEGVDAESVTIDVTDSASARAVAATEAFLPLLSAAPAGRIVNVSSTMGSPADQTDPESGYYGMVLPAYQTSKAALNAMTIAAPRRSPTPRSRSCRVSGLGQDRPRRPRQRSRLADDPDEGASIVTRMALIEADGPTGGFFDQAGPVRW